MEISNAGASVNIFYFTELSKVDEKGSWVMFDVGGFVQIKKNRELVTSVVGDNLVIVETHNKTWFASNNHVIVVEGGLTGFIAGELEDGGFRIRITKDSYLVFKKDNCFFKNGSDNHFLIVTMKMNGGAIKVPGFVFAAGQEEEIVL
ncbi:hypothetical protein ACFL16_01875 [Patescibacteria group bacterium]